MAKAKKPLKAALQSQQSRLKLKQKATQAAQTAELKKNGASKAQSKAHSVKGKGKEVAHPRAPTIPFRATDKILLIGEGNFSFARALVVDPPAELEHLPARNITATAYDTEPACYEKYPEAEEIVLKLKAAGIEVLFGIDATRLSRVAAFKGRTWDRIVWNFPHAGKGITDQDRNILSNQLLVLGFLRSAAGLLATGSVPEYNVKKRKRPTDDDDDEPEDVDGYVHPDDEDISKSVACRGTILITLRNVVPYTQWDVPRLAKHPPPPASGSAPSNPPYTLLRSFAFSRNAWKGYEHRMTKGERAYGTGKTGEGGEDRTWEFFLQD
ncbi:hypothetical protein B0H15DRAFT_811211 [Mycena belliarum]|uniref:25S rRNA (uridine-N(3))-methyltransferase BMT5-like domain-containing protein n=1 Tax=Mycena belliarum TaxID=1033014 RepID=A0AAD6ULL9_9AGAR|nr:hypothetical protein B0H15DRAFT_811211 [Mycena belliae]